MPSRNASVAIIGAGITGISTAYYLAIDHELRDIVIVDAGQPMAFTSAQSGENYRNWWPHPAMVAFTERSIELMETIARDSGNRINMTRRGYALATRETDIDDLLGQVRGGADGPADDIRIHTGPSTGYQRAESPDWEDAPGGVDVLRDRHLIRESFPSFDPAIRSVVHIRRAGDISGQQLGMHMLETLREHGGRRITGLVEGVEKGTDYMLSVRTQQGLERLTAERIVNAAGPFAADIARMLDVALPLRNVFQQKIAFEDAERAIPRKMPFAIDLDRQQIDWSDDEREMLAEDPAFARFTEEMPGAIHCRPDGGDRGTWLRLGWAFNDRPQPATWEPPLSETFPEIVLRGASRLNPSLKRYYGRLPRRMHHYGGWYTMTEENWPLIGGMGPEGAYMNCAQSGFGTMAACAAGELCAAWVAGATLPAYADGFSMARYNDPDLMSQLSQADRGLL